MKKACYLICLLAIASVIITQGAVITVTTTNNVNPGAGEVSFAQALKTLHDGDEIRFNLPGPFPHYIATPPEGYPLITNNNVLINGYSQPGSVPNSNPILATNVARIGVVLDSRSGGSTSLGNIASSVNDDPGYNSTLEAAVLAVAGAQNFQCRGLSFLGVPAVGANNEKALYFISFARAASGQIGGCWFGVDPDGKTVAGAANGVTGFRYQSKDEFGAVTNVLLIDNVVIGVPSESTSAVQQFNVFAGMPGAPIVLEGDNHRISGNFIMVLPDGLHDFDVALDPALKDRFLGAIEIGRGGNNTLIGTDGDGVNDENERNIFGGMLPAALGGRDQLIEFYGLNPGTNIVIAGNYFGIGVDGKTQFTNGVPIVNASGPAAQYRIGSNIDNLSDPAEGNLIANNFPSSLFPASEYQQAPEAINFFSQLTSSTAVSLRGNSMINNFPFPASPARSAGAFLTEYYSQVLEDPAAGVTPILSSNSTVTLLQGTVPKTMAEVYPATTVDLYIADPVGITNGMAAEIPQLPQGFVQGLKYVSSFVENSTVDKDPVRGSFKFDLTRFNLPPGTRVTVTANYSAPVGVSTSVQIDSISRTATGVAITWSGVATLQSAESVLGPWQDISVGGNSYEMSATVSAQFFRLMSSGTSSESGAPPLTSPFSNAVSLQP